MDSISSYSSTAAIDQSRLRDLFNKIDSDGDGQFSIEEFEAAKPDDAPDDVNASEIFSDMDTDGDGFVSQDEFAAAPPPPPPPPSSGGMLDSDMMTALLEALEESTKEETTSTTSQTETEETSEESYTVTEEDILEILQQDLHDFRRSTFNQANSAYTDATQLSSLMASQQSTLATL